MLTVALGHSEDIDERDAADELLNQCKTRLNGHTPNAGLLFSAIDYDHEVLVRHIHDAYPDLELIGCTTDGEISSELGFAEDSVTLMLFHTDTIAIGAGIGRNVREHPEEAAQAAVEAAMEKLDGPPRLCVALPEGIGGNTAGVLRGLTSVLGPDVPICGGMSGDQMQFRQTFQFYGGEVTSNSIVVLLFSGPLTVSYAVDSGWQPIGERHRVTHAEGNVVITIDDRPASDLYTHYFEEHSIHYPMAVFSENGTDFYLSTPAAFDEATGSVICQNTVPTGSTIQLAEATRDQIIGGASTSVERALDGLNGAAPSAGLLFSCAGRRAALGTRTGEEYERLNAFSESPVPLSGFYTYGELCPLPDMKGSQSHNCAFVTVLLSETPGT